MTGFEEFRRQAEAACGPRALKRSALRLPGAAEVFERVLGGGKYRRVLEIGTYRGFTAAYMAQFCERVTTIDLRNGQNEAWGAPVDRVALWAAMGIRNIDLHLVEDDAEKAAVVAYAEFDFAFIDGDHSHPAPTLDFELVRRCGAVLFHDYGEHNGVTRLVSTLPAHQVEIMGVFAFWRG